MSSVRGFRRRSAVGCAALIGLFLLAACEPEATPLPAVPVATSAAAEPTEAAAPLPSLAIDTLSLSLLPEPAQMSLGQAATLQAVEAIPDGAAAVSFLPLPDGQPSAYAIPMWADFAASGSALEDPAVSDALAAFMQTGQGGVLRLALANAGFPDGLTLTVAVEPALAATLLAPLQGGPIRWRPVLPGATAAVAIHAADVDGAVQIGVLPLNVRGVQISLTADGLPAFVPALPG